MTIFNGCYNMKTNFDVSIMQKKGQAGINSKIAYLIGALILIVLAVSVAPTMFTSLTDLANETLNPGVPVWVPVVLFVIVGAGLVFLIWRSFGN